MRDYGREATGKVRFITSLLIIAAIVLTLYGGSEYIGLLVNWTAAIITGIIVTAVVQILIQTVSGDFLERIPFTFKIKGRKFSLSLFFILTIVLKLIIFR